MKKIIVPILLLIVFSLTVFIQSKFLKSRFSFVEINPDCPWCETLNTEDELIYLPVNTSSARLFAPADSNLISDILWLKTTYYFGVHSLTDNQYFYLHSLLDMITDLSPRWELPYVFGAVILPIETNAADDALYLIRKGIKNIPFFWNLHFFKGYLLWKYKQDSFAAAHAFFQASQIKGAPKYLAPLSATMATQAGEKELAMRFITTALKTLKDPLQKKILFEKLMELEKNE